ncbi:CHASE2 domain-containing protein [Patescibacteria group bacterium]
MPKIKNKIISKLVYGIAIGAIVAIISSLLALWNPFNTWHLKLSNQLFTQKNTSDEIVIVAIDDQSIESLPTGLGRFYNWRRTYYADVINKLQNSGAKTIGIDLFFTEKSQNIPQQIINSVFSSIDGLSELEKANATYELFSKYHNFLDNPDDIKLAEALGSNIVLAGKILTFADNNSNFTHAETPIELFREDTQIGFVTLYQDKDSIVRSMPLLFKDSDKNQYQSFPLNIAQKYKQIDTSKIPLENNRMFINFFGPVNAYNQISFVSIYNDEFNPSDFKDKIVLIGVTSTKAAQDHFATPTVEDNKMPGVEIHANAIQTILEGKFLTNQTLVSQMITIAGIAIVAAIAMAFLNIWFGIALALLLILGYTGYAHIAYRNGTIINMVYPYIAIILTYFGSIIYKYFTELKAKKYIQTAFSRYLSPNVLKEVLKDPHMLHRRGMKREISVFFSDIAGFTTVSEKLDPEDLIELINDYLATMTDIVIKHEGTLDKYVGDAIVAYFGAPIDQPDHAKKVCRVALEMRDTLPKLHEKWKAEGKPLIDFRIGINTGEAIVGNVGSSKRFDYTIMGDEVNLGSRLEGANKKYNTHIMISESTYKQIEDDFVVRELDIIRVKGKNEPVRVYELLAHKGKLSEVGQSLLAPYNHGMRLYLAKNFKEAYTEFKKALEIYPEDGPSKLYLQRCDILSNYPPPEDWDGVFTMHDK